MIFLILFVGTAFPLDYTTAGMNEHTFIRTPAVQRLLLADNFLGLMLLFSCIRQRISDDDDDM